MADDTGNDGHRGTRFIAVVEDDHRVLESLEDLLQSAGYRTLPCASAEDFLQSRQRAQVDALITDVGLPGMSGLELVLEMQQRPPQLPTILITGRTDAHLEQDALELGVLRLLTKPFDTCELLAVLDWQFARRR